MKLYFIRHGQTDWNEQGKIQGSYDSMLNETGIEQAKEAGQNILDSGIRFEKIYSSKQQRASKTAEIISEMTKVDYLIAEGLEEICLGEWEGLTWREARDKFPVEYGIWYNNRRYSKPPRGESYQEMIERVLEALRKIVAAHTGDMLVVTHSAVIMHLQCLIENHPFEDSKKYKVDNVSIIAIDSNNISRFWQE